MVSNGGSWGLLDELVDRTGTASSRSICQESEVTKKSAEEKNNGGEDDSGW